MPQILPKAVTKFNYLNGAQLGTQAQAIHDGLVAAAATFPAPPVLPAALQTLITTYNAAYAASIGGSKLQRSAFHDARLALKNAIRVNATYVNSIVWAAVNGGQSYTDAKNSILSSGYQLNTDPSPVGVLPYVTATKWGSFQSGTFSATLNKIRGARGYSVLISDLTGATQKTQFFTSRNVFIDGLISGHNYTFAFAAVGANPTITYGLQINQWII